jgi:hypothetical protein
VTWSGRELTPARLHDALGLPRRLRPPARGFFDDGTWIQTIEAIGTEAATGSAIVRYEDEEGGPDAEAVVARLPFDGRPPSVVDRTTGGSAVYVSR